MPTSATGKASGFTLVELMVVMVIVGLASAAVLLAIPGQDDAVRGEATALAARLVAARYLAIIGGRDVKVAIDSGGYAVQQRRGGDWQTPEGRALAAHRFSGKVTAQGDDEALLFDVTGMATPGRIDLASGNAGASITVDAAGAVMIDAP